MHSFFFQRIGWIFLLLALVLAGAADQGALTAAETLWGGALGVLGLLLALFGQCAVILRAKRAAQRPQRVPVRVYAQPARRVRRR